MRPPPRLACARLGARSSWVTHDSLRIAGVDRRGDRGLITVANHVSILDDPGVVSA